MGHGTPHGLMSMNRFESERGEYLVYIIDRDMVPLFKGKENNLFLWCNADQFVDRYQVKGLFYSGMFISEEGEAEMMGLDGVTEEQVDESNNEFVRFFAECGELEDSSQIHAYVTEKYGELAKINPVAEYNNVRLYWA